MKWKGMKDGGGSRCIGVARLEVESSGSWKLGGWGVGMVGMVGTVGMVPVGEGRGLWGLCDARG